MAILDQLKDALGGLGLSPAGAEALLSGVELPPGDADRRFALVTFDVDSVQAQVLASPRPVTIQGASSRLRKWDEALAQGRAGCARKGPVLFAGGGQATLLVRAEDAPETCSLLEHEFAEKMPGTTCTVAWSEFAAQELALGPAATVRDARPVDADFHRIGWNHQGGGGFGACLAIASLAQRGRRTAPRKQPDYLDVGRQARCAECARRPRAAASTGLCERCHANRTLGANEKGKWAQAKSFLEVAGGKEDSSTYVGFVKLDGRGIGRILHSLRSIGQYAMVSRLLREAFDYSKDRLHERFGLPENKFQVPICGGDDLLLVVPARWKAASSDKPGDVLTLVARLLRNIERTFARGEWDDSLFDPGRPEDCRALDAVRSIGVGAGIVLTSSLPAKFAFDYANELVRSAKEAIGGSGDENHRSGVDFVLLSGGSPLSDDVAALRKKQAEGCRLSLGRGLDGNVWLTRKPYAIGEFEEFLDRCRMLSGMPKSALHNLRTAMLEPNSGLLTIMYQLARLSALRKAFLDSDTLPMSTPDSPGLGPWLLRPRTGEAGFETPLADFLEAIRFVAPGEALEGGSR